jgi:reverse transcriptase-like protein/integrase-like protein
VQDTFPSTQEDWPRSFEGVLREHFPNLSQQQQQEILGDPRPETQTTEPYYSLQAKFIPNVDQKGVDKDVDWRLSDMFDDNSMRKSPYPTAEERTYRIHVNAAYKRKDKKVQPVNANDGTGSKPGGRPDWYERSFERFRQQEPKGKYCDYLLPRIAEFPRGTRITPERLETLNIGAWLWPEERAMLDELLMNREGAIAFDWNEVGRIHHDVCPPIVIKTIPHEAWQEKGFPCPRALLPTVVKMLLERLDRGVLELCNGPYRNPWFLVAKKEPGSYRLINAAMKMNSVTLRDANMPPSVDEISEECAGCHITSLVDFFSGYDQLELDVRSRDMTAFMTPLGLLRMVTPPQGATNSVAEFVRCVIAILRELFPKVAMPFVDDVVVKGPYTNYDNVECIPGIRRFVFEHLVDLDKVLERIERAGACIGPKSQFCADGMGIVGFIVSSGGRSPAASKVAKIAEWVKCDDVSEVKAFMGICVYYRIWIKSFSELAEPLYRLCKKDVSWEWGKEQEDAMIRLQEKLISPPLLCKLQYDPSAGWGEIVLAVDSSLKGWGATLGQVDNDKRLRVSRYESGLWNAAEQNYDATKRECRGILKSLQKLRFWLYGTFFILETDAKTLVHQLNRAATDLPGALVTRWIAWIRLFDFEVRHVKGKKHTAADGLSRKPRTISDDLDEAEGIDVDEFIALQLDTTEFGSRGQIRDSRKARATFLTGTSLSEGRTQGARTTLNARPTTIEVLEGTSGDSEDASDGENTLDPLNESYTESSQKIARYLTTLERPIDLGRTEFRQLVKRSANYSVRDRQLWRSASKSYPPRLVVDSQGDKAKIMRELHDKTGHAGRESTYHRVAMRYFWEGCWIDCRKYVQECRACQHRDKTREEEALHPSRVVPIFGCVGIDVVKLPDCGPYNCLVVARDDFSGWPEAKPMKNPTAKKIAQFLWSDVICRHGVFGEIKVDGGGEFKKEVVRELQKLGIKRRIISAYNSKGNGMIERGHQPIINALLVLTAGGKLPWLPFLATVLLADRTTVHAPTGYTPFFMMYGREAVLPVETRYPTWRTLPWETVEDRSSLIAMRARQLEMRDADIEESILRKQRYRKNSQAYFDDNHRLRKSPIVPGNLVLTYDVKRIDQDKSSNTKLLWRWLGPYRVREANQQKGYYILEELDGTLLRRSYAGNRIKRFVRRDEYWVAVDSEPDSPSVQKGSGTYQISRLDSSDCSSDRTSDEEESANKWRDTPGTQEIERQTGVIVRLTEMPESERSNYLSFETDSRSLFSDMVEDNEHSQSYPAVEITPIPEAERAAFLFVESDGETS